jgi:hypothetical protein
MAFRKKSSKSLDEARQVLVDINRRIEELSHRRDELLLAGDDRKLDAVDSELATAKTAAGRQSDRINLLQLAARREEAEAVAERRAGLVLRFEKKLAEADRVADELQACIALADKLFRKLIEIRQDCRAAWPLSDAHHNALAGSPDGCALSGAAVRTLLMHEIYRVGARPIFGGRPGEIKQPDFPGGACPKIELHLQPEKIAPFADVLRQASRTAVDAMRGKLNLLVALPPAEELPAVAAPTPMSTNGNTEPQRSAAQERLAGLLKRQQQLSEDLTAEGEAAYKGVIAEIATVQDQIKEQQHG